MDEKQNILEKENKVMLLCIIATIFLIPLNAYIWTIPLFIAFVCAILNAKKTKMEYGTLKNIGVLFLFISAISIINSKDFTYSIINWSLLPFTYAILYITVLNFSKNEEKRKRIVYAFLISSIIVLVYGFFQYADVHGMAKSLVAQSWVDVKKFPLLSRRMYSTLENPNLLGTYLIMIISFATTFLLHIKERKIKILLSVFLVSLLAAAALTYSRGTWISLAAMVVGLGLIYDKRFLLLLLFVPLILFFYHGQTVVRFMSLFSSADTSTSLRFGLWQSTLAMIRDYPLLGIGWGSYFMTYPDYNFYIQDKSVIMYHAHNMYLSMTAETGIIGGITYVLLIFLHGKTSFNLYKKAKSVFNKSIGLGGILLTIGIAVNGIGDYTLFSRSVSGCFWGIFALIMSAWLEIEK